jgi:CHAT domain-containing protein
MNGFRASNIHGFTRLLAVIGLAGSLLLAGCAGGPPPLADRFAAGRDSSGERCTANRRYNDPAFGGQFGRAYLLSCGGATASRPLAVVSAARASETKPEDEAACGAASPVTVAGIGAVEARRCNDAVLGTATVTIRFTRGGTIYRGAATPSVAGPMELALKALAGVMPSDGTTPATIAVEALASPPALADDARGDRAFDAEIALFEGIAYNRQGLYVEASRVLNDALSRLPAETGPAVRVGLSLEVGLADSNIRFTGAADDHFNRAQKILADNPTIDSTGFLERKRAVYRALDRLNRRDWAGAIRELDVKLGGDGTLLQNGALLAELNRAPPGGGATAAVAGTSAVERSQFVLDAQRYWAASVAYLAQGGPDAAKLSQAALNGARDNMTRLLANNIDPAQLLWLIARIERQGARIAANGPATDAAGISLAVARLDCALATLEGTVPSSATAQACVIQIDPASRARLVRERLTSTGLGAGEIQMQRAGLLRRQGRPTAEVLAAYDEAMSGVIASNRRGGNIPDGMEDYLDLLAQDAEANRASPSADRFFVAIQAIGEAASARQIAQLQSVVGTGGTTAAKVRERADLGRQVTSLRYAIGAATDQAERTRLETERAAREQDLIRIDADLAADPRFSPVDDRPATLGEVQAALLPDEVYLKLARVRARDFAIVIGKDRVQAYSMTASAQVLNALSATVRDSIREEAGTQLPFFRVAAARALFQIIAGPAEARLLAAKAIVIDPAGPLTNLPLGVLVADQASVTSYEETRTRDPNDYSKVAFLAGRTQISNALSPRSFLVSRALTPSIAPHPFIGFAEHAAPPAARLASDEVISLGLGCPIGVAEIGRVFTANKPISAAKLTEATRALGVPNAPRMIDEAFTDTAVMARTDLDQYEILHFATHGLPETQIGCADIPPSLVTTMGEGRSDGFLSFDEIAGLRLDANLVVLAACETSGGVSAGIARRSGQEEEGKSLEGLVRAFLTARARAVMATFWKVSVEEESDALFRSFYSHGRSETIGDALRDAQRSLIEQPRYSHPYYWGAYFVVGDASKTMLTAPKT